MHIMHITLGIGPATIYALDQRWKPDIGPIESPTLGQYFTNVTWLGGINIPYAYNAYNTRPTLAYMTLYNSML